MKSIERNSMVVPAETSYQLVVVGTRTTGSPTPTNVILDAPGVCCIRGGDRLTS